MSLASASSRRYDLISIDLDGTLVGSGGKISRENIAAVHRAREQGLRVLICTGRGWRECRHFLEALGQTDPVAVAGGSIIADARTGDTIHRFSMDESLVHAVVERMHDHNHAALVLKDPAAANFDYLVVQSARKHRLDPVMDWWFDQMKVGVRYVDHLHEDDHPEHTVRIGAFGVSGSIGTLASELHELAHGRGVFHHFPAVVAPHHTERLKPGEKFHILEMFDAAGNKWSAVQHVAGLLGLDSSRTVAIGDEINDVPMIQNAGLGIAMGNAIDPVRAVAKKTTLRNDEHGVAHAIDQVLNGEW